MSKLSIINSALLKLGQPAIASADITPYGPLADSAYMEGLDILLAEADWSFAKKRAELAPLADAPKEKWQFAYRLPVDFLRLVSFDYGATYLDNTRLVLGTDERYQIAEECILTNIGDKLVISYISNAPDSNLFTPYFRQALSLHIAIELAPFIANNDSKIEYFEKKKELSLLRAKRLNGGQSDPSRLADGDWTLSLAEGGECLTYDL